MKRLALTILTVMVVISFFGCMADMQATLSKGGLSQPPNAAEMAAAQERGCPVAVSAIHGERNSANGIDVEVTWRNISGKAIKYCDMEVYLKNAVNDRVFGEITGHKSAELRFTGPYAPGKVHWGASAVHKAAIYHTNATSVHIEKISVVYMDGTQSGSIVVDGMATADGLIGRKHF